MKILFLLFILVSCKITNSGYKFELSESAHYDSDPDESDIESVKNKLMYEAKNKCLRDDHDDVAILQETPVCEELKHYKLNSILYSVTCHSWFKCVDVLAEITTKDNAVDLEEKKKCSGIDREEDNGKTIKNGIKIGSCYYYKGKHYNNYFKVTGFTEKGLAKVCFYGDLDIETIHPNNIYTDRESKCP